MKLVLASTSKQRYDLMKMVGWKFEVVPSGAKEISSKKNPNEYSIELSKIKAESVRNMLNEDAIIIASDSIISMDAKIYEKPKNKEEAFEKMKEMSGRTTYAITGVTIIDTYKNKTISFSDTAEVTFKKLDDDEIKWYVDNEEKILKCSGYVLEGKASIFVDNIKGEYSTIIGLPISKVQSKLKELGYSINDFDFE